MIIHTCAQGSDEWLLLRVGKLTASDLGKIVDTDFKMRTGEMPKTLLYEKAAEAFRGQPLPGFSSWETEEGAALEDEARKWFAAFNDHAVSNVGFIETEDHMFGASPDALLDDSGGLELKAPQATNHIKYVLEGRVPPSYLAQVHGCIYASGRDWWKFCSYRRGYPPFVIKVDRDETICGLIEIAVTRFNEKLTQALEKLRS